MHAAKQGSRYYITVVRLNHVKPQQQQVEQMDVSRAPELKINMDYQLKCISLPPGAVMEVKTTNVLKLIQSFSREGGIVLFRLTMCHVRNGDGR